jgi:hypothetical protein
MVMVLVRFVFQAKWGSAGKAVEDFKKNAELMQSILGPEVHGRVLTDLSGPFDTVVQELEVESLAEWERLRTQIFANPEFQQAQASGENPYISGRTEFYTIEDTF